MKTEHMNMALKDSDIYPVISLNICARELAVFREITVVHTTGVQV